MKDAILALLSIAFFVALCYFVYKLFSLIKYSKEKKDLETKIKEIEITEQLGDTLISLKEIELKKYLAELFAKYGKYLSNDELESIIPQMDTLKTKTEQVIMLMSFIPKSIESTDFFNEELQKHIINIINKFVCEKIVNEVKLALLSPPDYLDEDDIKVAIESQKGLCPPSSLAYFRYNYELAACILVLSRLDEISPLFREEAEESAEKLLNYAKESGYLPSDKESK